MPVSHYVDRARGILFVTRSGTINRHDEDRSFQKRNDDPSIIPGIPVVVDCTGVDPPDTTEIVQYIADHSMHTAQRLKCGPLAIVVGSDVEYGMARMYQLLTETVHPDMEIFRSAQEAIDWLDSKKSQS